LVCGQVRRPDRTLFGGKYRRLASGSRIILSISYGKEPLEQSSLYIVKWIMMKVLANEFLAPE
jgi:hypothetical protein